MRLLLIALLAAAAAAHLLLPWSALQEAQSLDPGLADLILLELRLPRTMLVLGYGAVLGISGAALQAMFANPLASPDISGASSGAALGAVVGGYWLGLTQPLLLAACGAAGALGTLALLVLLAGRRADTTTLLLAGLAISLAAGAATSLALALAPSPFAFYDAYDWLMGSLVDRSLSQALFALVPALVCIILLLRQIAPLDSLSLGEESAQAMGYNLRRTRLWVVALSALGVGGCVAICGAIGFVGLVAPIFARRLTRGHPGRAIIPAALIGGVLLLAADLAVRMAPLGRTLPIGVVTAMLGAPFFLFLVLRMRRSLAS